MPRTTQGLAVILEYFENATNFRFLFWEINFTRHGAYNGIKIYKLWNFLSRIKLLPKLRESSVRALFGIAIDAISHNTLFCRHGVEAAAHISWGWFWLLFYHHVLKEKFMINIF